MILIDARGLRCPWPVLRLARALRTSACVELFSDDEAAAGEVAAFAAERGLKIIVSEGDGGSTRFIVGG